MASVTAAAHSAVLARAQRSVLRSERLRQLVVVSACGALALGLVVLAGWYLGLPVLLRVRSSFVAVQFNTGLCFVLCGASLLSLRARRFHLCVVLSVPLVALSGATLLEHIGNWNFGIDEVMWRLGVDRAAMGELARLRQSAPGRMAPNTALAFVLFALAYLIGASPRMTTRRLVVSAMLLLGATTLGAIAFAGYLTGIPTAYGWGHLTRMAIQTSVGVTVLGLGSLAAVALVAREAVLPLRRFLPVLSATTVAVAALMIWQALIDHDLNSLEQVLLHQATATASVVSRDIERRASLVDRIAQGHLAFSGSTEAERNKSGSQWLAADPGLPSIRWLDSAGTVVRETRDATQLVGSATERIAVAPVPASVLAQARLQGHTIISAPIRRTGYAATVLIAAPMYSARGTLQGFTVADIVPSVVLAQLLPHEFTEQYSYSLADGAESLAALVKPDHEREFDDRAASAMATVRGRAWHVLVGPTRQTVAEYSSGVPLAFLIAALVCALFTGWVVRAAQLADAQSHQLTQSVADLAAENEARRAAELARDRQEELLDLQSQELEQQNEELQVTATELAEQRDALTREEEFGSALVRSTVDAVAAFDEMGRVHAWNPAMASLTGHPIAQVRGVVMGDLLPFLHGEQEAGFVKEALSGRVSEMRAFSAANELWNNDVWLDLMVTPMRSADGRVVGGLFVARDVTERERVSTLILASKDSAEQANRTKSEFLARMSHELRTPLNAVIGFTNVLRRNRENRMGRDEMTYLDRINANGRHLLSLINEVLDLAKIEAGHETVELAPTPVVTLVRDTLADLEIRASEAGVSLVLEAPACAEAVTDGKKLKQVLINLVANALKFTPKSGRVTVRVQASELTGTANRIEVADTGIGIPRNRLEAIFEAFEQADEQTSRVYGGTGLGLSISRKLCALMNHDLVVDSEPGVGSTFSIVLQKAAKPVVRVAAANQQH